MVRLKHRYLLVNFLYPPSPATPSRSAGALPDVVHFHRPSSDKLTAGLLVKIIRDGIADLFGDYGAGMTGSTLTIKYFSPATSTAIIRVARNHYRLVWAALTFTARLPHPVNQDCVVQVVRVSGTIRKAEEEAIRRAKQAILQARRTAGDNVLSADALLSKSGGGSFDAAKDDEDAPMEGIVDDEDDEGDDSDA
ncbi:putative rpp14 pop5 family protein [Neofusicoccum parvum UCRNP2]|uniref:Ribonuclease P/MRP protein subunit POP5 n=1 Tax=Botryosphaeria parva (strain UCR-NP2) TaxID=1287680 RepID=R1G626_BOTPV|nr:putative rpp14 pop5 family protein [Neofusicoccum parvum UCRNP2]